MGGVRRGLGAIQRVTPARCGCGSSVPACNTDVHRRPQTGADGCFAVSATGPPPGPSLGPPRGRGHGREKPHGPSAPVCGCLCYFGALSLPCRRFRRFVLFLLQRFSWQPRRDDVVMGGVRRAGSDPAGNSGAVRMWGRPCQPVTQTATDDHRRAQMVVSFSVRLGLRRGRRWVRRGDAGTGAKNRTAHLRLSVVVRGRLC